MAHAYCVEAGLISSREAGKMCSVMRTDDLAGGVWLPGGGTANPIDLT